MHHPAIVDVVEDLVGPDILCWTTSFFIKEPGSAGFVSWHRDATYWGLDPEEVVTAWVAINHSNVESGCMRVIPGTHVDTFHQDNLLTRGQEISVQVDESRAVDIVLRPGEISLHDIKLVHGSAPNGSRDRRIGLEIRYVPTRVRQTLQQDSATPPRSRRTPTQCSASSRPCTAARTRRSLGLSGNRCTAGAHAGGESHHESAH